MVTKLMMIVISDVIVKIPMILRLIRAMRRQAGNSNAPIDVTPTPLPCGLTYFYREFDSEYRPNPGVVDIFSNSP